MDPTKKTLQPYVTGSSVLAIKYNEGIIVAADTLGSYGSLARFTDLQRMSKVTNHTLIGGSGDISDLQQIQKTVESLILENTGFKKDEEPLTPKEIQQYISRVMYNRRSRFDPLWNHIIVAGYQNNESFLGAVDIFGTFYEDNTIASGFGAYFAQPLLRKGYKEDLTKDEAIDLIKTCLKVLFYRDARTINKFQIAEVSEGGITISDPFELETHWEIADWQEGHL
ncbi:proteasome subunit beta type-4 [Anaeramoeba ignava]|uniref:Proteasome subunit beta n=1 Tax=Anaeramoeba ignava TaxID=1746090 RepID=A0A9Q0R809_ANAIG|nr:proteasome subunit beta type-4 [Anaeramoeba ignava]|eukprot:Anaeramoba_ignava/a465_79.p1 GENE.a465_79~~a465_79.p1  ORF type:complete len:225 (-),score=82.33 a465_79:134-808(-)